jgi:hypothetical protein
MVAETRIEKKFHLIEIPEKQIIEIVPQPDS